jgi:16S rRNA (cytidine1402-2'-O)-methyltransferase
MTSSRIYLIPTVIAGHTEHSVIPSQVLDALKSLRHFLAEDIRTARRYLSSLKIFESIESLSFETLDKDTKPESLPALMAPAMTGHAMGILSESGCPGVADPGSLAVRYAHEHGIEVVPLVGPSSILLALMASGLNGQRFAFHGYLPIHTRDTAASVRVRENESAAYDQTQIFIETPYRSDALFQLLKGTLRDDTLLTVAIDVTGQQQEIKTYTVKQWKSQNKKLPRIPVVFLFHAGTSY